MPDSVSTVHVTFDYRGHLAAFAIFAVILTMLGAAFLVHLRGRRGTGVGRSPRVKIAAFLAFAALYLSALHAWLFWRTLFDLRVDPVAARAELTMLLPERRVVWPLAKIVSIHAVPGYKGGFCLVVETDDGRRYRSPQRSADQIEQAIGRLRGLTATER